MKQVIVIRKDLNMRKGKMCAQAAHASMKVFFDRNTSSDSDFLVIPISDICEWVYGLFTKIVVGINSKEELEEIYNIAKKNGIPCSLILDAGKTEFKEPTYTCCAIGPWEDEIINEITGNLKLL